MIFFSWLFLVFYCPLKKISEIYLLTPIFFRKICSWKINFFEFLQEKAVVQNAIQYDVRIVWIIAQKLTKLSKIYFLIKKIVLSWLKFLRPHVSDTLKTLITRNMKRLLVDLGLTKKLLNIRPQHNISWYVILSQWRSTMIKISCTPQSPKP